MTDPNTCDCSLVLYFGDHILMTEENVTDLMFERANTNETVVLDANSRKELIINLIAVLSHGGHVLTWNSAKPFMSITRLASFVSDQHCSIPPPLLREKKGGSQWHFLLMENLGEMEGWKCHKVLLLLVHFLLLTVSLCSSALWVLTKQPPPDQYNVLSVVTPGFPFPYRSSSETYCLKLHVITALKKANLLGEEQWALELYLTLQSVVKLRFVKKFSFNFSTAHYVTEHSTLWNICKFILKHYLL